MADAQHTSSQDTSFRRSLLRNIAGAIGLVVLVAGVFAVLGMIGRADVDDPDLAIDDVPDDEVPEEDPSDGDAASDDGDPADGDTRDPDGTGEGSADDAGTGEADTGEAAPDDGAPGEAAPNDATPDDGAPEGDDAPEPDPEPDPPAPTIDPAEISVQVLDGYRQDGGAAADAVGDQLQEAGYRIIARNPALNYSVTTVLWTDGFEAEARQVAAEIGAAEVQQQPGNLSTDVNVHVVVGADRG